MAIENYWHRRTNATGLAVACLAAIAASNVLMVMRSDAYMSVLGIARPVGPMVAVVGLGFVGWLFLSRKSWIPRQTEGLAGYQLAVLIGVALPIPVIIVDWLGGFERGINAPAPDSLLFYPSIAVVAEFVFHVAPLTVAAILAFFIRRAERTLEFFGLGAAVAIEPILQMVWGVEISPGWANAYVGAHLLAFNVVGVYLATAFRNPPSPSLPPIVLSRVAYSVGVPTVRPTLHGMMPNNSLNTDVQKRRFTLLLHAG